LILRSQARAADYRTKAKAASALAGASALQQVRERHELAASTWRALAKSEERRASSLRRRFGRAAQAAALSARQD
jgi:hypothetical protein